MRTFQSTYISAVVSYDAQVWLQERLTIEAKPFASWDASQHFYRIECAGISADYESADGSLFVDVADVLKYANKTGGSLTIILRAMIGTAWHDVRGQLDQITIPVDAVAGLLNPDRLHLPAMAHAPELADYFSTLPPSVMLPQVSEATIWAEAVSASPALPYMRAMLTHEDGDVSMLEFNGRFMELKTPRELRFVYQGRPEVSRPVWNIQRVDDCSRFAVVEWVGASGVIKRHTWNVGRFTAQTANAQALQPDARTFRTRKGREDSCTIWLDSLTPYDFAYYADVMQSGDVRVYITDEQADAILGDDGRLLPRYAVEVQGKAWTPNDGEAEFQKLEVTIKTAKYDAAYL